MFDGGQMRKPSLTLPRKWSHQPSALLGPKVSPIISGPLHHIALCARLRLRTVRLDLVSPKIWRNVPPQPGERTVGSNRRLPVLVTSHDGGAIDPTVGGEAWAGFGRFGHDWQVTATVPTSNIHSKVFRHGGCLR